ncbi:hypothetical protein DFH07DRAFT_857568 [Mycena maculata]|uniref:Peptide hydrolase n=1 Tax=Mycena maculata TaxID=230809 RepID=A0AAD7HK90_9AGAR|nr:hypothetical protein DFH07DRAFT_857568 [Mycena maculata]
MAYTAELATEEQMSLISVESVKHPWKQNSIIIRMAPADALDFDPTTTFPARTSIASTKLNPFEAALGAGDDGSGTVTILEAYRALAYVPTSPLEFHFYAGEEGDLRGSQAIASSYEAPGKFVRWMVQFDMTVRASTLFQL